ncbi:MAG: fibrobacter succinogenes major paralogous domain-containing protein [Mariniphaga sp.]
MKNKILIYFVSLFGLLFNLLVDCKKEAIKVAPTVTLAPVMNITSTSATTGGEVTSDGGTIVTARGVCWGTNQNPAITGYKTIDGTGIGAFSSLVTGLSPVTLYYLRAYATNSSGTSYGPQINFTTAEGAQPGPLTDADGNVYHTITIGSQVWSVENLKTTKYRNGDPIANVTEYASWAALATGAYCWYNNDATTYKTTYGALYNWYAVDDSRNIAPKGWHVASDADWTILTNLWGGENIAGGKLKESGTAHWTNPNIDATNETGFTALPCGFYIWPNGAGGVGVRGRWWTSTASSVALGWRRDIGNDGAYVHCDPNGAKQDGYSVRCVKD